MTLILAALLLAVPGEPPPLRLATGLFTFVGMKDELKVFVPEQLATSLRTKGIVVVTPNLHGIFATKTKVFTVGHGGAILTRANQ